MCHEFDRSRFEGREKRYCLHLEICTDYGVKTTRGESHTVQRLHSYRRKGRVLMSPNVPTIVQTTFNHLRALGSPRQPSLIQSPYLIPARLLMFMEVRS